MGETILLDDQGRRPVVIDGAPVKTLPTVRVFDGEGNGVVINREDLGDFKVRGFSETDPLAGARDAAAALIEKAKADAAAKAKSGGK